jgi:citrate synthase
MVGSSQANLFASVSAGICALWGPLHGGANQAVIEMLERSATRRAATAPEEVHRRGQGQEQRRPPHGLRPPGLQELRPAREDHQEGTADEVLAQARHQRPAARHRHGARGDRAGDEYFVERKLYPNVDFYSGIIYKRARASRRNMFTVLFALGRLPGWIAQWNEQGSRITRPRQVYTGETVRDYPG